MIVDDLLIVVEDVPLDNRLLIGKELRMLLQPLVDVVWRLAPVSIRFCVFAVSEHDDRDVVLF